MEIISPVEIQNRLISLQYNKDSVFLQGKAWVGLPGESDNELGFPKLRVTQL